jgi:hypothetical protein
MGESDSAATDEASDRVSVTFDTPPTLVTWCLGTFHVAVLTVAVVFTLQQGGSVGDVLAGLNTTLGLGLYAFLWIVTCWTTRRGLHAAWRTGGRPTWKSGLARALVWGGVTGIVFFGGVFAVLFVVLITEGAGGFATVWIGLVGASVAALVGGIIGGVLGLCDVALLNSVRILDESA